MKPIMAILVLSMTLFANQIFTFDDMWDYKVEGDIRTTTTDAMGQALEFVKDEFPIVTIEDVWVPEEFTFVFWVKGCWTQGGERTIFRFADIKMRKEPRKVFVYKNDEEVFDFPINNHGMTYDQLMGDEWFPIIMTRQFKEESFIGTKFVDSLFMFNRCVGKYVWTKTDETKDTSDFIIGGPKENDTIDGGKLYIDHVCIFEKAASLTDYNDIASLYEPDEAVRVKNVIKPAKGSKNHMITYDALGRRLNAPITSIHINISNGQKVMERRSGGLVSNR